MVAPDDIVSSGTIPQSEHGKSMADHKEGNEGLADSYDHGHSHDHDHSHLDDTELRVRALKTLLSEKGYIDPNALNKLIDTYEHHVGPQNGAQVVARAWVDEQFKQWLLEDATAAINSLGFSGRQGEHMVVVENTPEIHNMVVCTLCSCYPWPVLGLPPSWYKSAPYRARAVSDPSGVLAEFGVSLPESKRIAVWDSTAEVRYLVLPERPANTGTLDEATLATLVTRNSMIGTGLPDPAPESDS
ncbi:MAG: nitrile hydratase subunit alpha [Granulosicoccus sp.]